MAARPELQSIVVFSLNTDALVIVLVRAAKKFCGKAVAAVDTSFMNVKLFGVQI